MIDPIKCTQCKRNIDDGIYDSRLEQYYCDEGCYRDWADDNHEEVVLFYAKINID